MNADRLIADAKKEVLALAASGYVQPQPRTDILALGNPALATLKLGIHQMKRAGYISDHDALIGEKLARILTGGDLNHRRESPNNICSISNAKHFCRWHWHAQDAGAPGAHVEDREAVEKASCGFAVPMCGKALPFRGFVLKILRFVRGCASRIAGGAASKSTRLEWKGEPFRTSSGKAAEKL
jgi:hypothetical protein